MSEEEKEQWNMDGKVICGVKSEETDSQLHLLALPESEMNLAIEQTALQAGENEISAGKRLLGKVDLLGKIISGDAIFAQRELSDFRLAGKIEFPYLEQVFRITKTSVEVKTGKQSEQTNYGITSLPVEEYAAKELLELTRKHWRTENGLHYRRDVTFKEDAVRKKSFNGGQIMAALNNLAIGILRKIGWENIAQARRYYEIQFAKGLELILNPIII